MLDSVSTVTDQPPPTTTPHTSFSQIDSYKRCSLAWYYRYVKGWISPPTLALANGKAGHAAVEFNSLHKISTQKDAPIQDVLDAFDTNWRAETNDVELEPGDDLGQTKDATVATLREYHAKVAPAIFPIQVEMAFDVDIPAAEDYQHPLRIAKGRIDLVAIDSNSLPDGPVVDMPVVPISIRDNKFMASARGRPKGQEDADESWQLTLYDIALEQKTGALATDLGFISFVPPGKTTPAKVISTSRNFTEMLPEARARRRSRLEHSMRMIQKSIDAGIYYPVDDPIKCGYCGYRSVCKSESAQTWRELQKGAA